jgi:hypothetical protein
VFAPCRTRENRVKGEVTERIKPQDGPKTNQKRRPQWAGPSVGSLDLPAVTSFSEAREWGAEYVEWATIAQSPTLLPDHQQQGLTTYMAVLEQPSQKDIEKKSVPVLTLDH